MVEAILFNLDDTLTEQVKSYKKIYDLAVNKAEIPEVEEDHEKYTEEFFKFFKAGYAFPRRQAMDKILKEDYEFDHEKVERFAKAWEEAEAESFVLKEGVKRILEQLSDEYDLYIVSNGTGRLQRMKLEKMGIRDFFDKVFISSEIGYRKPEQRFFNNVKEEIGTEDAVVVSHLPKRDIIGSKRAGLKAVWLSNTDKEVPEDFAVKIGSLKELPERISEV